MAQSKYKLDVLAYHEAGHAAAACFLHLPFTGVHIIATGDLLGALELAAVNLTPGNDADEFERRIVHSFAGPWLRRGTLASSTGRVAAATSRTPGRWPIYGTPRNIASERCRRF